MNPLILQAAAPGAGHTALSVNVNRVALLRNSRPVGIPDVVKLSRLALQAGAHGITVHPRPDARHITAQDVHDLAALLKTWPQAEYNLEGNPFHNLMDLVRAVRPHQATFVPDSVEQATSDHGWDLAREGERLRPLIAELQALGVRVSLFMDPQPEAMALARDVGADRVELYTEAYARAFGGPQADAVLQRYVQAAQAALHAGLGVNAGHDLNRDNLGPFLQAVPGVAEVSIGHAMAADALELGMVETVRAYLRCIRAAQSPQSPASQAGGPAPAGAAR
jgi:pyridoxine 5-phosphate synthase